MEFSLLKMAKTQNIFSIVSHLQKVNSNQSFGLHSISFWTVLNISYLTDSYIVFTLKMESVSKNTIFGLEMMVKSGLEKIILKSLHAEK